jgi:hypothetical protein
MSILDEQFVNDCIQGYEKELQGLREEIQRALRLLQSDNGTGLSVRPVKDVLENALRNSK